MGKFNVGDTVVSSEGAQWKVKALVNGGSQIRLEGEDGSQALVNADFVTKVGSAGTASQPSQPQPAPPQQESLEP